MKNLIALFIVCLSITSCYNKKADINDKLQNVIVDTTAADTPIVDSLTNKYSADAHLFEVSRDYNLALDSMERMRDNIKLLTLLSKELKDKNTKLAKSKDSLVKVNVRTKERLAVADYKLLRIREYNRIAAQGKNLKYLRGWIIRVLD